MEYSCPDHCKLNIREISLRGTEYAMHWKRSDAKYISSGADVDQGKDAGPTMIYKLVMAIKPDYSYGRTPSNLYIQSGIARTLTRMPFESGDGTPIMTSFATSTSRSRTTSLTSNSKRLKTLARTRYIPAQARLMPRHGRVPRLKDTR